MTRDGLIEIIERIEKTYYYIRKQFTVDLFDNELNEYINYLGDNDEYVFLSSLEYKIDNILEIIDKSITDYFIIRSVREAIDLRIKEIMLERKLEIDKQLLNQN
jgi:hypothetical protein